jgi:hypothetical protein
MTINKKGMDRLKKGLPSVAEHVDQVRVLGIFIGLENTEHFSISGAL